MQWKACQMPEHLPVEFSPDVSRFTLGVRAPVWGTFLALATSVLVVNPLHAQPLAYSDGLADRTAYENWFATLGPPERAGAEYWASQRSLRNPGPCTRATQEDSDQRMEAACREAQRRLSPTDARRRSEPEYRRGWNAFQEAHQEVAAPTATAQAPGGSSLPLLNPTETYKSDRAWEVDDKQGACTRLRDRRTNSPEDMAECNRHYEQYPPCLSYKGFAGVWFDMRDNYQDPARQLQFDMINNMANRPRDREGYPKVENSPEFRDMLRRLLNIAFSADRGPWKTNAQFSDNAYKICMNGRPF